jgi:hypothetical protein
MNAKIISISENHQLKTSLCATLLLLAVFSYMYFLSLSVVHVVLRQETSESVNKLHSEISQLEAEYIEVRHKISGQLANRNEYSQTDEKIFIKRGDSSLVLKDNQ